METKDYYKILGISEDVSEQEIKDAYRKLAKKYHPDMVDESEKEKAEVKFKEIAEAYYVLNNSPRRQEYQEYQQEKKTGHPKEESGDSFQKPRFKWEDISRYTEKKSRQRRKIHLQKILASLIAVICAVALYFISQKAPLNLSMILPLVFGTIAVWQGGKGNEPPGCILSLIGWILLAIEITIIASAAFQLKIWL